MTRSRHESGRSVRFADERKPLRRRALRETNECRRDHPIANPLVAGSSRQKSGGGCGKPLRSKISAGPVLPPQVTGTARASHPRRLAGLTPPRLALPSSRADLLSVSSGQSCGPPAEPPLACSGDCQRGKLERRRRRGWKTHSMFPHTPAATAALSVATRFYSPALLNHCVRSYLWGTMYGAAHGIAFDDELYYVVGAASRHRAHGGVRQPHGWRSRRREAT